MRYGVLAGTACAVALVVLGSCVGADEGPKDAAAEKEPTFDASKITLKLKDAALHEVLKTLAEQSGNLPVCPPDDWQGKPLTLDLTDVTYWQALDAVCAQTGLAYETTHRSRALSLVPKQDSENVSVHAGPVTVTLNVDEMKLTNATTPMGRVTRRQCAFVCVWEDRLPTLEVDLIFLKVVADDGTVMEVKPLPEHLRQLVQGDSAGPRSLTYMHLLSPPKDMARAREIRGVVRVSFGFGKDVITIDDALRGNRSATVGTSTLTVESISYDQGGALQLVLSETDDGTRVNPTTYPASSPYGVRLVDPKGGRHAGVAQWVGPMRREGQIVGPDGRPEGGILVRGVGQTTVRFYDPPHVRGEWKLEHTVPEKIVVREYPFVFKDVALPRGIERGPRVPGPAARPVKP